MQPVRRSVRIGCLYATLLAAACDAPRFEGPQIQSPPPGFLLQPDAYQERRLFPHRERTMHTAWVEASSGPVSIIFLDAHPGVIPEEEIWAAQDSARAHTSAPVSYGPVEPLTIDGRRAWGWAERLETRERGLDWIAYRAVVPYDTVTYVIEFLAEDPGLKIRPDSVKAVVASFAVGKTTWNVPLIAIALGSLVLFIQFLRARARERQRRLQSIMLKKIPKKEEGDPGTEGSGGDLSEAPPDTAPRPPDPLS